MTLEEAFKDTFTRRCEMAAQMGAAESCVKIALEQVAKGDPEAAKMCLYQALAYLTDPTTVAEIMKRAQQ